LLFISIPSPPSFRTEQADFFFPFCFLCKRVGLRREKSLFSLLLFRLACLEHKLPYTDCFAAALATRRKASLATSDKDFAIVEKKLDMLWTM
jgi:predicted nucleic acid-binding protein